MREWILENTTVTKEEYDSTINCNTLNRIVNKSDKKRKKYTMTYKHPFTRIKVFTLKKPTRLRCILFGVKKEKDYFLYKDVNFKVLAENIPCKNNFLYSSKRFATCFQSSVEICNRLKKSKIITALCKEPFIIGDERFIHSFVSCVREDKVELVYDATLNIIMEKDKYLELFDAKILSEIEREKMIDDIIYLNENNVNVEKVTYSEYLCFPEQIMYGLKIYNKRNNYIIKRKKNY